MYWTMWIVWSSELWQSEKSSVIFLQNAGNYVQDYMEL